MLYQVELIIINKDGVRDPEGETIQRYVVRKLSDKVLETRAGKYLLFRVESNSSDEAKEVVKKIANESRLFNPLVHKIIIRVVRDESSGN
ncbi:MAG: phosphoribosylformylglycinamidine synthase subunit PurS [Sulfolobaceae archaeon]|nr:phosphoribosylformylglycinamidine synthase subunit PurS [Sulfolobaceae archaeon]